MTVVPRSVSWLILVVKYPEPIYGRVEAPHCSQLGGSKVGIDAAEDLLESTKHQQAVLAKVPHRFERWGTDRHDVFNAYALIFERHSVR